MRLVKAGLVESREILPGQWIQAYHAPGLATGSRAGQFVHARPGDFSGMILRRPFSLNTADPSTGIVTIHFRVIGRGTDFFTRLRPGDAIDLLGPLGRPFEVDPRSRHLLLVAGGLGMAGVRMLADEAIRDARLAGRRPARPARCREAWSEAGFGQGRGSRFAGGPSEGIPAGLDGAEHGLRRRSVPRLRGDEHVRDAAAGLPRGSRLRRRGDRLGRGVVVTGSWR